MVYCRAKDFPTKVLLKVANKVQRSSFVLELNTVETIEGLGGLSGDY